MNDYASEFDREVINPGMCVQVLDVRVGLKLSIGC